MELQYSGCVINNDLRASKSEANNNQNKRLHAIKGTLRCRYVQYSFSWRDLVLLYIPPVSSIKKLSHVARIRKVIFE